VAFRKHTDLRSPEPYSGERAPRQYSFADFTLDLEGGFLWRGVEEVTLRPKAFEVLSYLVRHHGRLVSKNALTEAVWPDAAITDNSLAQCMVEIRRALNDDSQQLIRTVARVHGPSHYAGSGISAPANRHSGGWSLARNP
jgi:DNA-binding response OmpR family regulator